MSYEVDGVNEISCACGHGKIQITHKSNEWNQSNERIEILCNICKIKYIITREYCCPKPKHDYYIYYLENKENGKKIKLNI